MRQGSTDHHDHHHHHYSSSHTTKTARKADKFHQPLKRLFHQLTHLCRITSYSTPSPHRCDGGRGGGQGASPVPRPPRRGDVDPGQLAPGTPWAGGHSRTATERVADCFGVGVGVGLGWVWGLGAWGHASERPERPRRAGAETAGLLPTTHYTPSTRTLP